MDDVYYVKWPHNQRLPEGYRIFWQDGLYWWEHVPSGDCGGECWDRFAVRKMAIDDNMRRELGKVLHHEQR